MFDIDRAGEDRSQIAPSLGLPAGTTSIRLACSFDPVLGVSTSSWSNDRTMGTASTTAGAADHQTVKAATGRDRGGRHGQETASGMRHHRPVALCGAVSLRYLVNGLDRDRLVATEGWGSE